MQLESGARLGEYEIVAAVGSGGMGEVYRARDHRLGRDVAVKILPESFAENRDRLLRFQREAQSAGGLNHPNLLTIHELGVDRGRPFIVSELLDGSTLRDRMSGGPLAPRRAIDYASQIAEGLAAAHERGIVHRDLKPENIFVTRDGRVKILDFGLAKSVERIPPNGSETAKKSLTDPGAVVGTIGYMSPEQVRGDSVDARSDIFTLGAILYEMLSGRRAFHGTSSVDTMHAILHEDPPELSGTSAQIPPALGRIVNHCLEKDPEQRFQSARDLAFALESMSDTSGETIAPARRTTTHAVPLWIAAIAVVGAVSWFAGRAAAHPPMPQFRRLTYQARDIAGAAFTPDEQSFVYSTQGTGTNDIEISPVGSSEMRSVGLQHATVFSVSRQGDMAVLLNTRFLGAFRTAGTLARVPVAGGAPREIADNIEWADWTPSGDDLAIERTVKGKARIELPIGNILYESNGWITSPRVSPDGKSIAFLEHPIFGDDAGYVAVLDANHRKHVLTPDYGGSAEGLVWAKDGKTILFTAAEFGHTRSLYAVTMSGQPRILASAPGMMYIFDVMRDGRALVAEANWRQRIFIHGPNDRFDRELSWLDWSRMRDITPDGRHILFDETGQGGGAKYGVYVRDTDGSPAVRLGDGISCAFSPDGKSVLAINPNTEAIMIYPTGAGQARRVPAGDLKANDGAWVPDGKSIVLRATERGHPARLYVLSLDGGAPRPITAEGVGGVDLLCSPDGKWVYAPGPDGVGMLYSLAGAPPVRLPEITQAEEVAGWANGGKDLLYFHRTENPVRILQMDPMTHRSQVVREIDAPESIWGTARIRITPDGRTYTYDIFTADGDLYLLDGLKN